MKQNTDMLGTGYQATGNDKFSAAQAFHNIESSTRALTVDLSVLSFLSIISTEDEECRAMYLTGDEDWNFSGQGAYIPAKLCRIADLSPEEMNKYPVIAVDAVEGDEIHMEGNGYFLMASSMYKLLSRMFKIEGSGFGFLRDYSLAQKCAEMDITPITMVYREVNGVKKAFTFYRRKNENEYLKFDELLDAVRRAKYLLNTEMEVCRWEITQEKRSVSFSVRNTALTVSWSDIGRAPFMIEYSGCSIKTSLDTFDSDLVGILTGQFHKGSRQKESCPAA